MANPTLKATIPQAANVKSALWVSPDVVGGSGAWDAKNSVRYAPWGTLSSIALGSTGINGLSSPGGTNCGIDLGLTNAHTTTPFDVSGDQLTVIVCVNAEASGLGIFIQNRGDYSPNEGWGLAHESGAYLMGYLKPMTGANGGSTGVTTNATCVYAMTYDGVNCKLYRNGTVLATTAQTGALSYNATQRRAALFNYSQARLANASAKKIFGAIVYDKALTQAEIQAFGTSSAEVDAGSFHAAAFDFGGGTNVTHVTTGALAAGAATMAGTSAHIATHVTSGALVAGAATLDGTAAREGATTTHVTTGALVAGAATLDGTASHAASGSFVSDVLGNNTSSIWSSTAVVWEWREGTGIGVAPTSVTYGTGTTSSLGVLTCTGLPTGDGELLIATTDYTGVAYQRGTVA